MLTVIKSIRLSAAVMGVALVAAACSSVAAAPPKSVTATQSEFKIDLGSAKAATGSVTFAIKNSGTIVHEFVVMKSDLAPDKLPTTAEGKVDEASTELTHVDEVENIAAGAPAELTVDLAPGKYVLICNLPGHYAGGMHAGLEVVAAS